MCRIQFKSFEADDQDIQEEQFQLQSSYRDFPRCMQAVYLPSSACYAGFLTEDGLDYIFLYKENKDDQEEAPESAETPEKEESKQKKGSQVYKYWDDCYCPFFGYKVVKSRTKKVKRKNRKSEEIIENEKSKRESEEQEITPDGQDLVIDEDCILYQTSKTTLRLVSGVTFQDFNTIPDSQIFEISISPVHLIQDYAILSRNRVIILSRAGLLLIKDYTENRVLGVSKHRKGARESFCLATDPKETVVFISESNLSRKCLQITCFVLGPTGKMDLHSTLLLGSEKIEGGFEAQFYSLKTFEAKNWIFVTGFVYEGSKRAFLLGVCRERLKEVREIGEEVVRVPGHKLVDFGSLQGEYSQLLDSELVQCFRTSEDNRDIFRLIGFDFYNKIVIVDYHVYD